MSLTLSAALARLNNAAGRSSVNPALGAVRIWSRNGFADLLCSDGERSVNVLIPCPSEVGPLAVDLQAFRDALKGRKAIGPMDVAGGRLRVAGRTMPIAVDFPPEIHGSPSMTLQWASAAREIGAVAGASSADDSRTGLCGVLLDPAGLAVATDGHRLHVSRVAVDGALPDGWNHTGDGDRMLPRESAILLGRMPDPTGGGIDNGARMIEIEGAGWAFRATLDCDHSFPDWRQVVPSPKNRQGTTITTSAARLASVGKGAPSGKAPRPVRFELNGSCAWSWDDYTATAKGAIAHRKRGPDLTVGLNGRYLADAVAFVGGGKPSGAVGLRFADALGPIPVRGAVASRGAVIMPMRLE